MTEVVEKSARLLVAEEIAAFIIEHSIAQPYGGDVRRGADRRNRAYYSVAFSTPRNLDGVISVYSEKYFVVKYTTRYKFLQPEDTLLFKRKDDLLSFLKAAFVDLDEAVTSQLLEKVRAES